MSGSTEFFYVVINHNKEHVDVWGHQPLDENGEYDWQCLYALGDSSSDTGIQRGPSPYKVACDMAKELASKYGYKALCERTT